MGLSGQSWAGFRAHGGKPSAAAAFASEDSEGGPRFWPTAKVLRFVATFSNGHTAGNYVGALAFAFQFIVPEATWDQALVASAIKGKKKATYVTSKVAFTADETVKVAKIAVAEENRNETYECRMKSDLSAVGCLPAQGSRLA